MKSQSTTISPNAHPSFPKPKNSQGQAAFNTSWTHQSQSPFPSARHTRQAATPISAYSTVQTGAKSHAGGFQAGLAKPG